LRVTPALVLFFLAPAIAELLSGSAPPSEFFNPISFILLASLYGSGALIVRELKVRWNKGYVSMFVLGAAYGIIGEEDDILYNLEATPAEEVAGRFAKLDKYSKGFYTNSYHCPVDAYLPLIQRIEIESQFHPLTTGGTVFHTFLGERVPTDVMTKLVQRILSNYKIAYLSMTPTLSICPKCGKNYYGIVEKCSECRLNNEIWSRIVGYYRPIDRWNEAKLKEFYARVQYLQGRFE